jgi:hypothetical protein
VETKLKKIGSESIFSQYQLKAEVKHVDPVLERIGETRYIIRIPHDFLSGLKQAILQIEYTGDIGHAFIDGDMISDNFCNGAVWEIGLKEFEARLENDPIVVYITPLKVDSNVQAETTMAGRKEEISNFSGEIKNVSIKPVYEWSLS